MLMPPKKKKVNTDEWISTYGDCVTLLLCFFVMLLAASKMDTIAFEQIRTGMVREFTDRSVDTPITLLRSDLEDDLRTLNIDTTYALGSDHDGLTLDLESDIFFEDLSDHIMDDDVLARLISMPNVLVTSHQAFLTDDALESIAKTTVENILSFFSGEPVKNEIKQ